MAKVLLTIRLDKPDAIGDEVLDALDSVRTYFRDRPHAGEVRAWGSNPHPLHVEGRKVGTWTIGADATDA